MRRETLAPFPSSILMLLQLLMVRVVTAGLDQGLKILQGGMHVHHVGMLTVPGG